MNFEVNIEFFEYFNPLAFFLFDITNIILIGDFLESENLIRFFKLLHFQR